MPDFPITAISGDFSDGSDTRGAPTEVTFTIQVHLQ